MNKLREVLQEIRGRRGMTIDDLVDEAARLLPTVAGHQTRYKVTDRPDVRTIRYYVTRGLLPKAHDYEGGRARYGGTHLIRLLLIKKLQAEHHTLTRISSTLEQADDRGVMALLLGEDLGSLRVTEAEGTVRERRLESRTIQRIELPGGEGFRLAHPDYSELRQSRRPRPRGPDPVSATRAPAPGPTPAPISSTADAPASGPDTEKRPADRSGPTPEPRLTDTPRRLGAAWSSPDESSLSATGKDPFADSVRSPILEKHERAYYVPKPSLIPVGWRPQPPAFIAAGVLGGIIWIIWTLFFK